MSKPKHEPWFKPRADEDADEELINWLGKGGGNGNGGGRNNHGRKHKDSCMVMLVLMLGGGAAAVLGGIAAVRGLA